MQEKLNKIYNGNNLDVLKNFEDNSIDALISDFPYALSFMNAKWDTMPRLEMLKEFYRVLKAGAFLVTTFTPRLDLQSELCMLLKEAGFDVSFSPLYWAYKSGFPKASNYSKVIQKNQGVPMEVIGENPYASKTPNGNNWGGGSQANSPITKPTTPEAIYCDGLYSLSLKPALEPILRARKPLTIQDELIMICSTIIIHLCQIIQNQKQDTQIVNYVINHLRSNNIIIIENTAQINVVLQLAEEVMHQAGRVASFKEVTDTLQLILGNIKMENCNLNWSIELLCLNLLEEIYSLVSKSTTKMKLKMITELKTLNYSLCQNMQNYTTKGVTLTNGLQLTVFNAINLLIESYAYITNLNHITAHESVTENRENCQQNNVATAEQNFNSNHTESFKGKNTAHINATTHNEEIMQHTQLETKSQPIIIAQKPHGKAKYKQALDWYYERKELLDKGIKEEDLSLYTKNASGGIYVDSGRIPCIKEQESDKRLGNVIKYKDWEDGESKSSFSQIKASVYSTSPNGRFPANLLCGFPISKEELRSEYPEATEEELEKMVNMIENPLDVGRVSKATPNARHNRNDLNEIFKGTINTTYGHDDTGDLSRYFSLTAWSKKHFPNLHNIAEKTLQLQEDARKTGDCLFMCKPAQSEKNAGLEGLEKKACGVGALRDNQRGKIIQNTHPTTKPIALYNYLVTLFSKEGDIILDPFCGSGTTLISCVLTNRRYIGIEMSEEYYKIAEARVEYWKQQKEAVKIPYASKKNVSASKSIDTNQNSLF